MYPPKGQNQDYTDYTMYTILGIPRIESEMCLNVFLESTLRPYVQ